MKLWNKNSPRWAVTLVLLFAAGFMLAILYSGAWGTTWNTPAQWPEVQDSIHVAIKTLAGAKRDSVFTRSDVQIYDTSWTISDDSAYQVVYYSWGPGEDSAATWTWVMPKQTVPSGTGPYIVKLYAIDTSGTDTLIPQVRLTVFDTNKVALYGGGQILSSDGGSFSFNLNAGYYTFTGDRSLYVFIDTSITVSASVDSLPLHGYNVAITRTAPVAGHTALVTITIARSDNTAYEGVRVSAYLARSNVIDSAGRAIVNLVQTDRTDSLGQVDFTCIWSSYLVPATQWVFTVHKPSVGGVSKAVTVTDTTFFNLNFLTHE